MRRVTISDLQYFVAKADSKLKKLRATLGDYDSQDIEHHKVLKTIFSLVKKLLRLPGDDAAKEFLQTFTNRVEHATNQHNNAAKINLYESSGSSDSDSHLQAGSDYFPNIQGSGPSNPTAMGGNPSIMPQVRQSPFSTSVKHQSPTNHGESVNKSHNIVIKSNNGTKMHNSTGFDPAKRNSSLQNRLNMSANQSDLLSLRESAAGNQNSQAKNNGQEAFAPGSASRNKSYYSKTIDQGNLMHQVTLGNTPNGAQIIGSRAHQLRASDIINSSSGAGAA